MDKETSFLGLELPFLTKMIMNRIEAPLCQTKSYRLNSLKEGIEKVRAKLPDGVNCVEFLPNLPEGKGFFYQQEAVSVGGQQISAETPVAVLNAISALGVDPQMTIKQMALSLWKNEMERREVSPDAPSLLEEYAGDALVRISPAGIAQLFEIAKKEHLAMKYGGHGMHQVKLPIIPFRFSKPGWIHRSFLEGKKGVCLETTSKCVFAIVGARQKGADVFWLAVPSDDCGLALIKSIESDSGHWLKSRLPPHVFAIDPSRLVDRIHFPSWLVAREKSESLFPKAPSVPF